MKKLTALVIALVILTGCTGKRDEMDRAMRLRADLLGSGGCSFTAHLTADYGDAIHEFTLYCEGWNNGDLGFRVEAPDTICGITGRFKGEEGALTFDDVALAFPLLAEGELSPVSAPWLLINTLRSGYLISAGDEGALLHLTLHDSYEADAMQIDVWTDRDGAPQRAEFLWQGRRMLSIYIKEFTFV